MHSYSRIPVPHSLVEVFRFGHWLGSLLLAGLIGLLAGTGVLAFGAPLWLAVLAALAVLAVPLLPYWAALDRSWGRPLMVLSVLLALQTFHSIEHGTQWFQFHILGWPAAQSGGLISPLNAEVVHFAWNWVVLATMAYLWRSGMCGWSGGAMLAWAAAHTLEHTYMFVQYL